VAQILRWSDARISFGWEPGEGHVASLAVPSHHPIPLPEISLVICRGTPAVHSKLPARSRRYAEDEWNAALSLVTSLPLCPILNSPFPVSPAARGYHTSNSGRRLSCERPRGSAGDLPAACLSNLVPPAGEESVLGVVANRPAAPKDLALAAQGFELLALRRLPHHRVPLFWIVNRSVVLEKSLDLNSGAVSSARFGPDCVRVAEGYAQRAGIAFGTLWLFPRADGGWQLGGFDLFPPQQHARGDERVVAAAICEHYADSAERVALGSSDHVPVAPSGAATS
jgi:hypothetical protein